MELVNRLQDENRRIKQSESPFASLDSESSLHVQVPRTSLDSTNLLNESDFQKLKRMRGQMEKQRDELMCRDQEIEEKNTEIENVCVTLQKIQRWKIFLEIVLKMFEKFEFQILI